MEARLPTITSRWRKSYSASPQNDTPIRAMGGEPGEHLHVDVGLAPPAEIQVSRLPDVFDVKRKRTGINAANPNWA
ncbi:hypothetical protein KEM48_000591 [Puccinia striiformis f. sp. tritici PST-130]|nr:hypothetical protein KEM48_000591 [Puccinia striiformis f. sp. tritici PST-130]